MRRWMFSRLVGGLIALVFGSGLLRAKTHYFFLGFPAAVNARSWNPHEFRRSSRSNNNPPRNPYTVLGVSSKATSDEIRRSYRKLCLQYHPDKQRHLSKSKQVESERLFKELQHAHDQIGTPDDRKAYDRSTAFPWTKASSSSSSSSSSPNTNGSRRYRQQSPYATTDDLHRAFAQAFGGGSGASASSVWRSNLQDLFAPRTSAPSLFGDAMLQSIYLVYVTVPLSDLYTGHTHYTFALHDTAWRRLTAAMRGGIGPLIVYQSLLYSLPVCRILSYKVVPVCLGCLVWRFLPRPAKRHTTYTASIRPGYKGGTRLTFNTHNPNHANAANGNNDNNHSRDPQVQFVVREGKHPVYRRVNNDLHASWRISPQQAREGCTLALPSLHNNNNNNSAENINAATVWPVEVPAGTQSGDVLVIPNRGWPNRKQGGRRGNLVVTISVVKWRRTSSTSVQ